jgi:hypothetical protein
MHTKSWKESWKERGGLEGLGIDGIIILKTGIK